MTTGPFGTPDESVFGQPDKLAFGAPTNPVFKLARRHPWDPVPPLEGTEIHLRPMLPAPRDIPPLPILDSLPPPGVVLGHDINTGEPLRLVTADLIGGGWILGKNGLGKTVTIEVLAEADIREGRACIVLDPAGDLTENLIARMPEHRMGDVILLDASDKEYLFGINPVSCPDPTDLDQISKYSFVIRDAFKKVTVGWGAGMNDIIPNAAHILLANPGASLADMNTLFTDVDFRARMMQAVKHPPVREWATTYDGLGKRQGTYIQSTMSRVNEFLRDTRLYSILNQTPQTVNFPAWINSNKIVLIKLDPEALAPDSLTLVGALLLQQVKNAARQQVSNLAEWDRPLVPFYVDEFPRFATPEFGEMFRELRKSAVVPILAHQDMAQLVAAGVEDIPKAARHLFFFGISGDDVGQALREFHPTPEKRKLQISPEPLRHIPHHSKDPEAVQLVRELSELAQKGIVRAMSKLRSMDFIADQAEWRLRRTTLENAVNQALYKAMQASDATHLDNDQTAVMLSARALFQYTYGGYDDYMDAFMDLRDILEAEPVYTTRRDDTQTDDEALRQLGRRLTSFNVHEMYCKVNQNGRVTEQYVKAQPLPRIDNKAPAVLLKRARIRQNMIDAGIIKKRDTSGEAITIGATPPPPPSDIPAAAEAFFEAVLAKPVRRTRKPLVPFGKRVDNSDQ